MLTFFVWCILAVAFALLLMLGVHSIPKARKFKISKEAVGLHFASIGAIYAVLLAFMLSGVWQKYEEISTTSEREANYLMGVFRLAQGMSEPDSSNIRTAARQYAQNVIEQEWPGMAKGEIEFGELDTANNLWKVIQNAQPTTRHDEILYSELLSRQASMGESRRIRLFRSNEGLPTLLWAVLIIGAVLTISLSFLLEVHSLRMHVLLVSLLTVMITLELVAIHDLSTPFRGSMPLQPNGLRQSVKKMDRLYSQEKSAQSP